MISEREREHKRKVTQLLLEKNRKDFVFFAKNHLKVSAKGGGALVPFILNEAQENVHYQLMKQLKLEGIMRGMVLKPRQVGLSTLIVGMFAHEVFLNAGVDAFAVSDSFKSAQHLFSIFAQFHENTLLKPTAGIYNRSELNYPSTGSAYSVATAGRAETGRGRKINLYHGSEVCFWENSNRQFASSVQTVPNTEGTKIILESTANGASGAFFERYRDAQRGKNEYIAVFIPWFDCPEYKSPLVQGFKLSEMADDGELSEVDIKRTFKLSLEQMQWRRKKLSEIKEMRLFQQEYPCTAEESFQYNEVDSFISSKSVIRARHKRPPRAAGAVVMGVDPAGEGADRFAICIRQGFVCRHILWRTKILAPEAKLWVIAEVKKYKPDKIFIDMGGMGAPIYQDLKMYPDVGSKLEAVNFGGKSQHRMAKPNLPGAYDRKSEMWSRLKDWLNNEDCQVSIPNLDVLQADLLSAKIMMTGFNFKMESKSKQKTRSADLGDALALTFADLNVFQPSVDNGVSFMRQAYKAAKMESSEYY